MEKFGDPGFAYHKTLTHFWTLLVFELADLPKLPLDARDYAQAVLGYVDELKMYAPNTTDLSPLEEAAGIFVVQADMFHSSMNAADHASDRTINNKLMRLERDMLDLSEHGGVGLAELIVMSSQKLNHASRSPDERNTNTLSSVLRHGADMMRPISLLSWMLLKITIGVRPRSKSEKRPKYLRMPR